MAWNNNPYNNMVNNGMPMNGYTPSYTPQVGYSNIQPSMQLNQYTPQPQPQQMAQNVAIQGRMVTSKEEALGVPVDFLGQPMFFPDLAHGVIYLKRFNTNTGAADFAEFRICNPQPQPQPMPQNDSREENNASFVNVQDFQDLNDMVSEMQGTIANLEREIDRLKKPVNPNSGKAVKKNESGNE